MKLVYHMRYHEVRKISLSSGISLIHIRVPNIPYSAVAAFVHSGSRFDPTGSEGLAHFFEHLLGVRTERHPLHEKRLRTLEENGIDFYAETDHERIALFHIQPAKKTDISLKLLVEALFSSVYDGDDINRERYVIINETQQSAQDPMRRLWWTAAPALWPESLLSRRVLGNGESLKKIDLSKLQSFQSKYFIPERTKIVIIESNALDDSRQKTLQRTIGNVKAEGETKEKKIPYNDDIGKKPRTITLLEDRDEDQVTLGLFFRTVPAIDFRNRLLCGFLRDYLGGTWTSRLVQRLRIEENITYWVDADTEYFTDTGSLEYTLSLPFKFLQRALEIIFGELSVCKDNLIDTRTLEMIKNGKIYAMEKNMLDPNFLLEWYGEDSILNNDGQAMTVENYMDELNTITPREIQEAAQAFFSKERTALVALGIPKGKQQKLAENIKLLL